MNYFNNPHKGVKRGDIFYISNSKFYSTDPSNEAGRPGIVVSCDELNEHSMCVEVVYLTTKDKKPMPTHIDIMCKVPSTALCETIYTVSKDRLGDYIRTCSEREMATINRGMLCSLGISPPRRGKAHFPLYRGRHGETGRGEKPLQVPVRTAPRQTYGGEVMGYAGTF